MDEQSFRSKLRDRGRIIAQTHSARVLSEFLDMLATPEGAAQVNATGDDLEAIKEGLRQALREKEREELRAIYEKLESAVAAGDPSQLQEAHELFVATTPRNLNRVVAHLETLTAHEPEGDLAVIQTLVTFALAKNEAAALQQAAQLYGSLDAETRRRVFDVWMFLSEDEEEQPPLV